MEDEVEAVKWRQITDTMLTKYGFKKRPRYRGRRPGVVGVGVEVGVFFKVRLHGAGMT